MRVGAGRRAVFPDISGLCINHCLGQARAVRNLSSKGNDSTLHLLNGARNKLSRVALNLEPLLLRPDRSVRWPSAVGGVL